MFSLPCIHLHPFCDLARGVGPGWSCGRVWLRRADPASGKGSCLPEHSWWPHWNCYWFILMWRWADLRPVVLSDEVFPASRFRKNTKLLCRGRKKKCCCFFFFSLSPNPSTEKQGGKENSKYFMGNFVFAFFLLKKRIPHANQNKMEPWSPTCWLEGTERGKGRCLVVCQAFSTGLVALWCGTWSSRGLEPAIQMQQELLWKRAS